MNRSTGLPFIPQGQMAERSDTELMLDLKRGNVNAFNELVTRHQGPLINYFYRLTWDRQASEDSAQEVFLRIFRHAGTYEPQAKFTTYLYRIARNLWIDRLRSAGSAPKTVSLDQSAEDDDRKLSASLASDERGGEEEAQNREMVEALRKAIERLPEEQRMVIILSEHQGMKYQEVAEVLDIPVGTVKSRMHAAVAKLRELMAAPS